MFQEIIEIFGELPRSIVWIQVADMNDLLVADNMVIGDDEWNRNQFFQKSNGDTRRYPRYDLMVDLVSQQSGWPVIRLLVRAAGFGNRREMADLESNEIMAPARCSEDMVCGAGEA